MRVNPAGLGGSEDSGLADKAVPALSKQAAHVRPVADIIPMSARKVEVPRPGNCRQFFSRRRNDGP